MLRNNVLIKKFRTPTYKTPFWVVVSDNIIKSIDTVEDVIDYKIADPATKRSIDAYTVGYEDHEGVAKVIVFVRPNLKPGRVAHECNHIKNIILNWNGVKPSFVNDEAESYLLEYFVDKVIDVMKGFEKRRLIEQYMREEAQKK
jgi:hypothetical protein